jgi:hypothetical protein
VPAADLDALFKLPPTEFTAARNALVSKLKKAGKTGDADTVKGLSRPSISAWAVNQLYWRHRRQFDALMDAGERFKKAQAAQLAGKAADIRAPLEARRAALAGLSTLAANLLDASGHTPSPDTMRRINTTLEALATYGAHPGAPQPGRLTDDVDPPGFEALAALVPRGGGARSPEEATRVIPFHARPRKASKKKASPEEEKRRAEEARKVQAAAARAAVQEAEQSLREAKKRAQQAEAALKVAAAKAKQAEKERAVLDERYARLTAKAEQARHEARRVASHAEDAAQAVEEAELALEKARREVRSLE